MHRYVKPAVRMLLASGMAFALPTGANAAAIVGLYNTGVDAAGSALVGGNGVVDPHYKIVETTDPTATVGNFGVTYFNSAYAGENANSRWISTTATGGGGGATTRFQLTFDLTGYDATTAYISGKIGGDNNLVVYLNNYGAGWRTSFASFIVLGRFYFSMSDVYGWNFVDGLNTLDFYLRDDEAPAAFRVDELQGTANLAAAPSVPEPATWGMMIFGFGLIGSAMRRGRVMRPHLA